MYTDSATLSDAEFLENLTVTSDAISVPFTHRQILIILAKVLTPSFKPPLPMRRASLNWQLTPPCAPHCFCVTTRRSFGWFNDAKETLWIGWPS